MTEVSKARYTYRLRVSKTALTKLRHEWDCCRWVWNKCTEISKEYLNQDPSAERKFLNKSTLDPQLKTWRSENEFLAEGAFCPQQQAIRTFFLTWDRAWKDRRNKVPFHRRTGFPRFKSKKVSLPTLAYAGTAYKVEGKYLKLPKGIKLRVVWHRDLPSPPSSVRVYQNSIGEWYASFVVETKTEPLASTGRTTGIDWGVKTVATTTDPEFDYEHPEFGKKSQKKLTRYQRMMARRRPARGQPASNGYKAAKKKAARVYKKAARQREDSSRKWAKALVMEFDQIAVEDFKPKFLFSNRSLSRKSADAAIGAAKEAVLFMGRKHERDVRLVDPAHTTMDCSNCGTRAKDRLPLSQREYVCSSCGFTTGRDRNAAAVVQTRATFNPGRVDRVSPSEPPGSGVP